MSLVNSLLGGLFPHACCLCGLPSRRQWPLCTPCERDLTPNHSPCRCCALPLAGAGDGAHLCGACLRRPPHFDRVVAPWQYTDPLAHLIRRWKYRGDTRLTALLAHLWLTGPGRPGEVDVVLPVPLHWRRRWRRGFNQAELLARQLLRSHPDLAVAGMKPRLARRGRSTPPQSGTAAGERKRNLRGAFTAGSGCANLRLAIVDDVLTTGSTADALAGTLRAAGASRVEVWCVARTPAPAT